MSSAASNDETLLTNLSVEANNVDPDLTAPRSSQIWAHTVCQGGSMASKTFQQTTLRVTVYYRFGTWRLA